jgi:hypothetical protein
VNPCLAAKRSRSCQPTVLVRTSNGTLPKESSGPTPTVPTARSFPRWPARRWRYYNGYNSLVVFVLDNYDSFTYNLVQYLGELGAEVEVRRNDEVSVDEIEAMHPERIVVSPGPCTPQEAGISIELIRHVAGNNVAGNNKDKDKNKHRHNVPLL